MRFDYNSTRPQQSAASLVSTCHRQILIANLELNFRVNPIGINELKFSNRKFSTILHPASPASPSFELQSPSLQNLIANARLRFDLSPSRISLLEISNRERMAVSQPRPEPRRSKLAGHSSPAFPNEAKHRRKATRRCLSHATH